jgi:hypothetical protein
MTFVQPKVTERTEHVRTHVRITIHADAPASAITNSVDPLQKREVVRPKLIGEMRMFCRSIEPTRWKRRTPFFGVIITAADGGFSHAQLLHYTHKTFRSFGHVSTVAFSDPNDLRLLCGRRHDARKKKTATRAPTLPPHSRKTQTSTPEAAKSHVCSDTKTPRAGRCEQR